MKTSSFVSIIVLSFALSPVVQSAPVTGQGTWETTLQARDLDGNNQTAEAWYDTSLNITWLGDVNYAGLTMDWVTANNWAQTLNPYGSGTGWRLPTVVDIGNDGCNFSNNGTDCGYNVDTSSSELAHMFYITLGNLAYYNTNNNLQGGYGLTNTALFNNFQSNLYWTATSYDANNAWSFITLDGGQGFYGKYNTFSAWAVHNGDIGGAVSTVPVPAAVWLFVSGLIGLTGFVRRKNHCGI